MPSALEQWAFDHQWPDDEYGDPRCLECRNYDNEGHKRECALGAALQEAGFPVKWYIGPMHGPWPPLRYDHRVIDFLVDTLSRTSVPRGMSAAALNVTPTEWGFAAVIADRVKSISSLSHPEALAPEQRGEER